MKRDLIKMTFVQLILLLSLSPLASANDESYTSYDNIIRELSTNNRADTSDILPKKDPYAVVKFHAGVGLLSSQISLHAPTLPSALSMHGYEARFGIDLFSPNWEALGAVRTFDPENSKTTELHLREFDLLVLYKTLLSSSLIEFSVGGGMTARYLDLTGDLPAGTSRSYTTPSTVLTTGLSFFLTPSLSLGVMMSYRNPMISDTIDHGALDGGLQVSGHF